MFLMTYIILLWWFLILCSVISNPVKPPKALHLIRRETLPSIKRSRFTVNQTLKIFNQDISNGDRFMYLMLALEDEPLALIQPLPLSPCFDIIVEAIDNKRLIMSHQIDAILQDPVVYLNSTVSMRYLLSTVNENVAALKA
ncbi:hypothetical protein PR048_026838 [Dryococelus australis]|uniref:Uncharacterized protein n=1 Tax=Dryococelus australis TaxID=614101 RepID=A0ABQ9GMG0_9NEOP|nr:hypothetical protein PR048_026838 [Dryococelus australis]